MLLVALHSGGEGERAAQAEVSEGDDHRLPAAIRFDVADDAPFVAGIGDVAHDLTRLTVEAGCLGEKQRDEWRRQLDLERRGRLQAREEVVRPIAMF